MLKLLFLLFIIAPLTELYLLIKVGSGIGGFTTIVLCLLTAAIGGLLIRWQGIATLIDAQKCMARGEIPADHGFHGILLAIAGLLLFLPGFITDTAGFLLLIPALRQLIINKLLPIRQISGQHDETIIEAEVIHHEHHIR